MAKKSTAKPAASAAKPATLEQLVAEKMSAGLPRHQAEEVAKRQLAHDAALGGEEPEAAEEGASGEGEPAKE